MSGSTPGHDASWSSATAIAASVARGERRAADTVAAALDTIARRNPTLNAFTDVLAERAHARAAALDAARAAGTPPGPLAGVPFAVKNLIDVAGLATRAGSRINRDNPPAAADGTLVTRLEAAGAVLVGALNMGEYAYDFTGENCHDGPSRNPHDPARMTGGSSGGSGAAVAGGMVPLALGSDTNGSIRVPASFCGLFGLKPTYGRLSRAGSFPFVASLDHLGPLARSAADLAAAYDAMQGHDPLDPACANRPAQPAGPSLGAGADGLRIAVAGGYFRDGATARALDAVARVATALGATRREVELPEAATARAAAYVITTTEGAALHLNRLRTRPAEFDPDVRDRLIAGALLPAAAAVQAQKFRRWFRAAVLRLFEEVDVILAPATPTTAPLIGQKTFMLNGAESLLRPNIGIFTQPLSFIGLPVVAVPVPAQTTPGGTAPGGTAPGGTAPDDALPIGVQVIAAPWREDIALRVAAELERQGVARAPRPPLFSAQGT